MGHILYAMYEDTGRTTRLALASFDFVVAPTAGVFGRQGS